MTGIIQGWIQERRSSKLGVLPAEIIAEYASERAKMTTQISAAPTLLARRLVEVAMGHLDFCYHDLLHLRKEKILRAVAKEGEIDPAHLQPWEVAYVNDLRRIERIYLQQAMPLDRNIAISSVSRPAGPQDDAPPPVSVGSAFRTPEPRVGTTFPRGAHSTDKGQASATPDMARTHAPPSEVQSLPPVDAQDLHAYVTVRFLQAEGAIVGADMREYGPFATGDVALLPEIHARIFVANGSAQEISPSD